MRICIRLTKYHYFDVTQPPTVLIAIIKTLDSVCKYYYKEYWYILSNIIESDFFEDRSFIIRKIKETNGEYLYERQWFDTGIF